MALPISGHRLRACSVHSESTLDFFYSYGLMLGLSEFLCEAGFHYACTKRSLNMTANCVFASAHSRGGRFHSAAAWFKTRYSSFAAASSEGKCPLVLTARRSFEFSASIAFVV